MSAHTSPFNITNKGEVGTYYQWVDDLPRTGTIGKVHGADRVLYTDAEFAAAFRPAEHLDQLLDAVRWEALKHGKRMYGPHPCTCFLCTALRQWDAP